MIDMFCHSPRFSRSLSSLVLLLLLGFNATSHAMRADEAKLAPKATVAMPAMEDTVMRGGDFESSAETLPAAIAGRDITLTGTIVNGVVSAGREVTGNRCTVAGAVTAGRDAQLNGCTSVQALSAGRDATVHDTLIQEDLKAGRKILLSKATIMGNVTAGAGAEIQGSTINGTLSVPSLTLTLNGSTVNRIHVLEPDTGTALVGAEGTASSSVIVGNNNVVVRGSSLIAQNGHTTISVGPHGRSYVNGYTVTGSPTETTVRTPEGILYRNGDKTQDPGNKNQGPSTYQAYRDQTPGAPSITGPGWVEAGSDPKAASRREVDPKEAGASALHQVVQLSNNTVVTGDIVFESGHGQVIVDAGSQLQGKVIGGTVESR